MWIVLDDGYSVDTMSMRYDYHYSRHDGERKFTCNVYEKGDRFWFSCPYRREAAKAAKSIGIELGDYYTKVGSNHVFWIDKMPDVVPAKHVYAYSQRLRLRKEVLPAAKAVGLKNFVLIEGEVTVYWRDDEPALSQ